MTAHYLPANATSTAAAYKGSSRTGALSNCCCESQLLLVHFTCPFFSGTTFKLQLTMAPNFLDNSRFELENAPIQPPPQPNDHAQAVPFQPPNPQLIKQIVEKLEEKFQKNIFLQKTICSKKDHFVNLTLIAKLCGVKDWRDIAFTIKHASTKLELEMNQDGTRVRPK